MTSAACSIGKSLFCSLLSVVFSATALADELSELREENARLRSALAVQHCSNSTPAAAMDRSAPFAVGTSKPLLPAPPQPNAGTPDPTPPAGYKLVRVAVEPYADSGCKGHSPGARWKQRNHWDDLSVGMSGTEVEELLGKDHYDVVEKEGRVSWQYGKCEAAVRGTVVLNQGKIESIHRPIF